MLEYKKMAVVGAALALATVFGTNAAQAAVVLDANYTPAQSVYGMSLGSIQPVAQTFTVQNTGVLSAAAVKIESVNGPNQAYDGGVTLEITKTIGGLPSLSAADILGSATKATNFFPVEGQGGYSFINFSVGNIGVIAGEELAIQLFSTAYGYFGVNGDLGGCCGPDGSYADGQGLLAKLSFNNGQILVTGWQQPVGFPADFAFETFVTPSAVVTAGVPEPSAWALMLLGVFGRREHLQWADPKTDLQYQDMVAALAAGRDGRSIVMRRAGEAPIAMHVLPIRGSARDIFQQSAAILILASGAASSAAAPILLQALFDLSPAEARVVSLIGEGRRPAQIGKALKLSDETVRSHLKSAFLKTNTNRQSELAALVAGYGAPGGRG